MSRRGLNKCLRDVKSNKNCRLQSEFVSFLFRKTVKIKSLVGTFSNSKLGPWPPLIKTSQITVYSRSQTKLYGEQLQEVDMLRCLILYHFDTSENMCIWDFWEKIQPPRMGEHYAILRVCSFHKRPDCFYLLILSIKNLHFHLRALFHPRMTSPITLRSLFSACGLTGNDVVQFL